MSLVEAFSTPGCAFGSEVRSFEELEEYEIFCRTVALFSVPCKACAENKTRLTWISGNRAAIWYIHPIPGSAFRDAKIINLYRCRHCGCWRPPGFDGTSILNGRLTCSS